MPPRVEGDIMQNIKTIFVQHQGLIWDVGELVWGAFLFQEGDLNSTLVRPESLHLEENSKNKFTS